MPKTQSEKKTAIAKILKELHYPGQYLDNMITGTETRLQVIEFLIKKMDSDFCECYSDNDERIYNIKCCLLRCGLWGQQKHGRNIDINKLIEGYCSYELSLNFLYRIAKQVKGMSLDMYVGVHNSQEVRQLRMAQMNLFYECMKNPYQLINVDVNPFPISFPKSDKFQDFEDISIIVDEVKGDIEFMKEQKAKIAEKLIDKTEKDDHKEVQDHKTTDLYKFSVEQLKREIDRLKQKKHVIDYLADQNPTEESQNNFDTIHNLEFIDKIITS